MLSVSTKVANGLVSARIHGGPRFGIIKENAESDLDPEPFQSRFLGSGTGARTIYGTGSDLGPNLSKE